MIARLLCSSESSNFDKLMHDKGALYETNILSLLTQVNRLLLERVTLLSVIVKF